MLRFYDHKVELKLNKVLFI